MTYFGKSLATAFCVTLTFSSSLMASDMDVIKAFYSDLLTTPVDVTSDDVNAVVAPDWESIPTPRGGPGAEGLLKTLLGFGNVVPDLKWEVQEILRDGNRFIVRGKATGTPITPFLGIDPPTGKSFEIMSIDIHTVENGRIVKSFHVEEWATAMAQLRAE